MPLCGLFHMPTGFLCKIERGPFTETPSYDSYEM